MESQVLDAYKVDENRGYIEANDWALPYESAYLKENTNHVDTRLLQYVNCNFLSTPGRPPTLQALKQHAQSLTVLISLLAPSSGPGEINNANQRDPDAQWLADHEAYDWLNNLTEPYKANEAQHHRPLNSLVNLVQGHDDLTGTHFHCPLDEPSVKQELVEKIRRRGQLGANYLHERDRKPFARHFNLLKHANDILEMLDHEYSATGGLLSILPLENDDVEAVDFEAAKTTLIGQWLLFTQQLVVRMHDLEIAYANSLDLLDGEAFVPMQHMSAHGPDGRSGREIVFPQDRWILANAGDDVSSFIHQALDRQQIAQEKATREFRARGATGSALDGDTAADPDRGLVKVDLISRFYRLGGHGNDRGPIFILPAYADRPGTKYTREIENRPTVVSIPVPTQTTRISEWEKSYSKDASSFRRRNERDAADLARESTPQDTYRLQSEVEELQETVENYRDALTKDQREVGERFQDLQRQLREAQAREQVANDKIDQLTGDLEALMPNDRSWSDARGMLPRDLEGNITERAVEKMMALLKRSHGDNTVLANRNRQLQEQLRDIGTDAGKGRRGRRDADVSMTDLGAERQPHDEFICHG